MNKDLKEILIDFALGSKRITILTGAGISAESNIPTFRGPEGYWTIGSREYHPQEMATYSMFIQKPDEVWKWYLYRLGVCKKARPNPAHLALVEMERLFNDRFTLITQNVDNLHIRAGNSLEKTFQIHGNIFYMRCANECSSNIYPLPEDISGKAKGEDLTPEEQLLLRCPDCGERSRPHVLWFDEAYNEKYYRYHSSLEVAGQTELLLIVGTSGTTNLPNQVAWEVKNHDGIMIDINIEENPFAKMALTCNRGYFIKKQSSVVLPQILDIFTKSLAAL
jgi:NAD-dependent deacetylase